jgi:hypothetical protein
VRERECSVKASGRSERKAAGRKVLGKLSSKYEIRVRKSDLHATGGTPIPAFAAASAE